MTWAPLETGEQDNVEQATKEQALEWARRKGRNCNQRTRERRLRGLFSHPHVVAQNSRCCCRAPSNGRTIAAKMWEWGGSRACTYHAEMLGWNPYAPPGGAGPRSRSSHSGPAQPGEQTQLPLAMPRAGAVCPPRACGAPGPGRHWPLSEQPSASVQPATVPCGAPNMDASSKSDADCSPGPGPIAIRPQCTVEVQIRASRQASRAARFLISVCLLREWQ